MTAFPAATRTLALATPGTLASARSSPAAQSAQSTPVTGISTVCSATLEAGALVEASGRVRKNGFGDPEELCYALVAQSVVDIAPTLFPCDQTAVVQTGEVVGHVGLTEAGFQDDLAHAPRSPAKAIEDRQPRRIGEAVEEPGLQLGGIGDRSWPPLESGSTECPAYERLARAAGNQAPFYPDSSSFLRDCSARLLALLAVLSTSDAGAPSFSFCGSVAMRSGSS